MGKPERIQVIPYQPIYGQIVGDFRSLTVNNTKFSGENNPEFLSERYKVRIFGKTRKNAAEASLPTAKIKSVTSGVGARSYGFEPILSPNTFVELEQDTGGNWWIVNTLKSVPKDLPGVPQAEGLPSSGSLPGDIVPNNKVNPQNSGLTSERPNTTEPNSEDEKQNSANKEEDLLSACKKINTDAINSELENLIKDIQSLKIGIGGEDSFLVTSQNFINDVQGRISQAAGSIANWTAWLVQEIRRYVLRKVNAAIGLVVGNAPLSTRYLVNAAKNKSLSIISCLFIRLLSNLENLLADALSTLIDKIINTATCLVENFISSFIGQIVGQLTALINGALSEVSSLIGSVLSFTGEILDFAISILDFLKCKPENICPTTEKWNPLEGGSPQKFNLDFRGIFESAKGIASSVEGLVDIPGDIENFADNFSFSFNSGDVLQGLLDGCNEFTGPEQCGPPQVVFWGGTGSGASGNAVVNAVGDVIGVDMTGFGEYTEAPFISIEDSCGNGRGAIGIPILGEYVDNGTGGTGDGTGSTNGDGSEPGAIKTGVIDVFIPNPGYGYLPTPDGSSGGGGRTWADRCQTIVRRANGDYDIPYTEGDVIRLYYGDTVTLPGKSSVLIDCDFTIAELPGSIETGTKYCFKSMRFFDTEKVYTSKTTIKSMVGFDDTRGSSPANTPPISLEHRQLVLAATSSERGRELIEVERQKIKAGEIVDFGRPDQFGYINDYPYARELGFNDTDMRFYIEGFYSKLLGKRVGPLMQLKLENPNFGPIPSLQDGGNYRLFDCDNDYRHALQEGYTDVDIRYFLETLWTGNLDECMREKLADPAWGRAPEYYISITAPGCPPSSFADDVYSVTPVVSDVIIENTGFGYNPNDQAIILDCSGEGESPAKLELSVDNAGRIINVKVIDPGTSFACIPKIIINTTTGYNAVLKPIMKFEQAISGGADADGDVIQVIDCVGKV